MSVVALTAWAMLVGATIQIAVSALLREPIPTALPPRPALLALLYLSVVAGAIGFVVYFVLIDRIGPSEANLTSYVTPIVALGVGRAFLDEPIPVASIVGLGVILLGFLLLEDREIAAELARFRGAAR